MAPLRRCLIALTLSLASFLFPLPWPSCCRRRDGAPLLAYGPPRPVEAPFDLQCVCTVGQSCLTWHRGTDATVGHKSSKWSRNQRIGLAKGFIVVSTYRDCATKTALRRLCLSPLRHTVQLLLCLAPLSSHSDFDVFARPVAGVNGNNLSFWIAPNCHLIAVYGSASD